MTKHMTDSEKIHALQTSLLMEIAENGPDPTCCFVAHAAFSAEDPIAALEQMQDGQHENLPPLARSQVAQAARMLKHMIQD